MNKYFGEFELDSSGSGTVPVIGFDVSDVENSHSLATPIVQIKGAATLCVSACPST
jgi:hypothetical protein